MRPFCVIFKHCTKSSEGSSLFSTVFHHIAIFFTIFREVRGMENASPVLNSTIEMLKNAISLQQQIRQEQSKR